MIAHLSNTLNSFPGTTNQMCCFAHTLSIVAKAILNQFDVPKGKADEDLDDTAQAYAKLTDELDVEEWSVLKFQEVEDDDKDDHPNRGWGEGVRHKHSTCEIDVEQGLLIIFHQTPNPKLTDLSSESCIRWHLFSRTLWPSFFLSGSKHWPPITFPIVWCHAMLPLSGIQHLICSTFH